MTKEKTTTGIKRADLERITAAGGVLFRDTTAGPEVLMIFRNGVWDLPKGKLEEGESVEECAVREVAEELGIQEPEIRSFLCETWHEYSMDGMEYGKTTYWYVMQEKEKTAGRMSPQKEEGITELKWERIDKAIHLVGYDNLRIVLKQFAAGFIR